VAAVRLVPSMNSNINTKRGGLEGAVFQQGREVRECSTGRGTACGSAKDCGLPDIPICR
jgi:hypothetical protein